MRLCRLKGDNDLMEKNNRGLAPSTLRIAKYVHFAKKKVLFFGQDKCVCFTWNNRLEERQFAAVLSGLPLLS